MTHLWKYKNIWYIILWLKEKIKVVRQWQKKRK